MNNFSKKIKPFLIKYKTVIIPGVPLLFFITMISFSVLPGSSSSPAVIVPGDNSDVSPTSSQTNNDTVTHPREMAEHDVEARSELQKKEDLPDNATKYYFTSPIPDRPNIIITKGRDGLLFQSSVTNPLSPIKISDYINIYGKPRWIFKGSNFYGSDAQTYIFPEDGLAFIANPKTGLVLERHNFVPTKIEDYLKEYGDDIPAYP